MADAVALIQRDHRVLADLIDRLADPLSDRAALVEETAARMIAHLRAEEKVYPLLAGTGRGEPAGPHRGVPAGGEVEERLRILRAADPASTDFDTARQELAMVFDQHVDEEESAILLYAYHRVNAGAMRTATAIFDARRARELQTYGYRDGVGQ